MKVGPIWFYSQDSCHLLAASIVTYVDIHPNHLLIYLYYKSSLLTLLDLVVTTGPRQGDCPLVRLSHSIGVGAAGPAQVQLSC